MTAHALMFVDKPTFFRFVEKADKGHRYEYVRGWVMQQQAGGTRKHAQIAARFLTSLFGQLDPVIWSVTGSDLAADTGATVRYADVMVEKLESTLGSALASQEPVVLIEVLSPSSEERDLATKPVEYMGLASLQACIVASQDEPLCYLWRRQADGAFAAAPTVVKGRDQILQVPELGIAIPIADLYRGIDE